MVGIKGFGTLKRLKPTPGRSWCSGFRVVLSANLENHEKKPYIVSPYAAPRRAKLLYKPRYSEADKGARRLAEVLRARTMKAAAVEILVG